MSKHFGTVGKRGFATPLGGVLTAPAERREGADILILARTDARHGHGLDEALTRAAAFSECAARLS